MNPPIPIGTRTQWGSVQAVGLTLGERYYWMVKGKDIAMIPASIVEAAPTPPTGTDTPKEPM